MALELNGTTGVSLVQDGVITDANLPAGSVLQVVSNSITGRTITTSTSFVSTQVTGSITPTSASSEIVVLMQTAYNTEATNRSIDFTLFRDATNLGDGTTGLGQLLNSGGFQRSGLNISYLDSPSTTSLVTYTLHIKSPTGGQIVVPHSASVEQQVILMEIAG